MVEYEPYVDGSNMFFSTNRRTPNRDDECEEDWNNMKCMFDGWYLWTGNNARRWTWYINEDMTVYAKWLPYTWITVIAWGVPITVMDRNLWATKSWTWCTWWNDETCWYKFQWWNNYGFKSCSTLTYYNAAYCYWFPNWETSFISPEFDDIEYMSKYYNWFFKEYRDWDASNFPNLWWWNSSLDEDKQWPCPNWYHVPSRGEWSKMANLLNIGQSWNILIDTFKLPQAGSIDSDWLTTRIWNNAWYRTSPMNVFYFTNTSVSYNAWTSELWASHGHSVRCFKDSVVRQIVYHFNWWSTTSTMPTYTVKWWQSWNYLTYPSRSNSTCYWWYTSSWFDEWTQVTTNALQSDKDIIDLYAKYTCNDWYYESDDWQSCIPYMAILDPNWWEWEQIEITVKIPKNTYHREGYKFLWWNTAPDWSGVTYKEYSLKDTYLSTNWKLYAQRIKNPVYTYNTNWWNFIDGSYARNVSSMALKTTGIITNKEHQYEFYRNVIKFTGANSLHVEGVFSPSCSWNNFQYFDYDRNESEEGDGTLISLSFRYFTFEFDVQWDVLSIETLWSWTCPYTQYTAEVTAVWYPQFLIDDLIEIPVLTWYTFSWWYESWALEPFDFTWTEVTQDRIFYAKWNPNKYTIQLDSNWWNSLQTEIDEKR